MRNGFLSGMSSLRGVAAAAVVAGAVLTLGGCAELASATNAVRLGDNGVHAYEKRDVQGMCDSTDGLTKAFAPAPAPAPAPVAE
jgi:hypothetical protein